MRDRHPPFRWIEHNDRAIRDWGEALALAISRAPRRGRQKITQHFGTMTPTGVWLVQDVRP